MLGVMTLTSPGFSNGLQMRSQAKRSLLMLDGVKTVEESHEPLGLF